MRYFDRLVQKLSSCPSCIDQPTPVVDDKRRRGDIWIDQLVQVLEQKPTPFRLDSGAAFQPVFENS